MEYEYAKIVAYGGHAEVFRYGSKPRGGRHSRAVPSGDGMPRILEDGKDVSRSEKPKKIRTKANARSAVMAFRRLVAANLGRSDPPILASFTYSENHDDISRGRKDFNLFAKRAGSRFGDDFRYIVVCEFQKRGALHFHALLWGVPPGIVAAERRTRLVAGFWAQGFVDLKNTDGSIRLAGYLAKYMGKMFIDERLAGRKAYIASQNIQRPLIVKDALLSAYFSGYVEPDLSTASLQDEREYATTWLGRCNYQRYLTLEKL